ncbi:hypothetical protein GCM10009679_38600 [Saccharothrix algeriensis]|uniref:Uncharacterized protein n=1 Tax=Catellatospora bangladeshensis TaxID=310355 RepID=A0A8J3JE94_9ACTN|nr:hypothetical protein Cba03nite_23780 [Catellatospora bangladeshensis]
MHARRDGAGDGGEDVLVRVPLRLQPAQQQRQIVFSGHDRHAPIRWHGPGLMTGLRAVNEAARGERD